MRVRLSVMAVLALVLVPGTAAILAQGSAGVISGRVTDPDGGAVTSVTVEAKHTVTAAVYKSAVSSQGEYTLASLPPGTYDLSIAAAVRYIPYVQKAVIVQAGRTLRVDISLKWLGLGPALGDDIRAVVEAMRAKTIPTGATPRMRDGKPDLSGVWLNVSHDDTVPPPLPLQPWAEAIRKERVANNSKDMPQGLCQPSSPIQIMSNFPHKLVQTPTLIVMLEEFDVAMVRQIFLDGRPHPDPKDGKMGSRTWNPSWLGHSIGTWEGDTLVVDNVGFNNRSWLLTSPHTEQLHVVERIRRPDEGHLEIDIMAEDAGAFTGPWNRHVNATLGDKDEDIEEFICNEDNIDIPHLVGK